MSSHAVRPLGINNKYVELRGVKTELKSEREPGVGKPKVDGGKENDFYVSTHCSVQDKSRVRKRKQQNVVEMLTSSKAEEGYWKELAEERRTALVESLKEIESLREQLEVLEAENAILKERNEENEKLLQLIVTQVKTEHKNMNQSN